MADEPSRDYDEHFGYDDTSIVEFRKPGHDYPFLDERYQDPLISDLDTSESFDDRTVAAFTQDEFEGLSGLGVRVSELDLQRSEERETKQREAAGRFYRSVSGWIGGLAVAAAPAIIAIARSYVLAHGDPQVMFAIMRHVNIFALLSGYLFWMLTYFAIILFAIRQLVNHSELSFENDSEIQWRLRYRANAVLGAVAVLLPILLVPPAVWQQVATAGVIAYLLVKVGSWWEGLSWRRYMRERGQIGPPIGKQGRWMRFLPGRFRNRSLGHMYPVFWGSLLVPVIIAFVGALTFNWMPLETLKLAPQTSLTTAYVLDVGQIHTELLTTKGEIVIVLNSSVQARAVCPLTGVEPGGDAWNRFLDRQGGASAFRSCRVFNGTGVCFSSCFGAIGRHRLPCVE